VSGRQPVGAGGGQPVGAGGGQPVGAGGRLRAAGAPATRRQLLGRATLLAAAGSLIGPGAQAVAQTSLDIASMEAAVRLEQALAVAYGSLAARPGIDRELRDMFAVFSSHEHQHAAALLTLVEYLGGAPPPVPTLAATEQALPGLAAANDRRSALVFAERLENAEVFGFYQGEQTLDDIKLMEMAAAVMCSDAQHLALVRQAAGENPIPSAFESGKQSG
jgi:hypothetical protein